jgi:uncharacterized membrane protein YdjX (TVP38/TMEM64 family)
MARGCFGWRPPPLLLLTLLCAVDSAVCLAGPSLTRHCSHRRPLGRGNLPLVHAAAKKFSEDKLADQQWVWEFREKVARGVYSQVVSWKEDERDDYAKRVERRAAGDSSEADASKSAVTASVTAVMLGAVLLRFGGRAALVSVLGLDMVQDLGINDQIDTVLSYADALGVWTVVGFLAAWIPAKALLIDVISIALAISSGILFGGVLQGALLSSLGATLGSLVAFGLSRTLLQERVEGAIEKQPAARALAKVVEEDGFKTVLVLRLAPVLPIPLGSYPYIYGTSKLGPLTFCAATFVGSFKPYLLDAYIGVFTKQVLDGESLDSSRDLILLVGLGALVLVGVFATQLANESWDKVQGEMRKEESARREAARLALESGEDPGLIAGDAGAAGDDALVIAGWNVTETQLWAWERMPSGARDEWDEEWRILDDFLDDLWVPAAREELAKRRQQETQRRVMADAMAQAQAGPGNGFGALWSGMEAAEQAKAKADAATEAADGDLYVVGADGKRRRRRSAAEEAELEQLCVWGLEGSQPWRQVLSPWIFCFTLFGAARRQWVAYPESLEALELLVGAVSSEQPPTHPAAAPDSDARTSAELSASPSPGAGETESGSMLLVGASSASAEAAAVREAQIAVERRAIAERQQQVEERLFELEELLRQTRDGE